MGGLRDMFKKGDDEEEKAEAQEKAKEAADAKVAEYKARQKAREAEEMAKEAEARAAEAEAKLEQMEKDKADEAKKAKAREAVEKMNAARAAAQKRFEEARIKIIAEHELGYDEALSTLALKYYGHATPPYYEWIYENNKDVIGDGGPNATKPGMIIKIPELPDELKD